MPLRWPQGAGELQGRPQPLRLHLRLLALGPRGDVAHRGHRVGAAPARHDPLKPRLPAAARAHGPGAGQAGAADLHRAVHRPGQPRAPAAARARHRPGEHHHEEAAEREVRYQVEGLLDPRQARLDGAGRGQGAGPLADRAGRLDSQSAFPEERAACLLVPQGQKLHQRLRVHVGAAAGHRQRLQRRCRALPAQGAAGRTPEQGDVRALRQDV
mmetsp:Transcript_50334/g.143917  ORF Transcript_50334/g.143917 Transcript_50334/m.143917 type:complete len:213 (-) Transcript_50334:238-876(-)